MPEIYTKFKWEVRKENISKLFNYNNTNLSSYLPEH